MIARGSSAVIRVDADASIGGGHLMRCLALAGALVRDGWQVTFVGTSQTQVMFSALSRGAYPFVVCASPPAEVDLPACDLLIIDHYGLAAPFESRARQVAPRILVIDDAPGRSHLCDVLLDQTFGREAEAYAGFVPEGCPVLAGSSYALLRPQFAVGRARISTREEVESVVIMLGATDPACLLPDVMAQVRQAAPKQQVTVIVGSSAMHLTEILRVAEHQDVRVLIDVQDVASVLAQADLVVAAAGSATWEICALARPMILIQIAENQADIVAAMAVAGAAQVADVARVADTVRFLVADRGARDAMARVAGSICDGRGAARVAMAVMPALATDGQAVTLRRATSDDTMMVLEWQRAPGVRQYAWNQAVPSEQEHRAWMARRVVDPGCLFNIIMHGAQPAGVIRLDQIAGRDTVAFRISIFIVPEKHRLGLGHAALMLARRLAPEAVFDASVHPDNAASHALFRGAGYLPAEDCYRQYPAEGLEFA